MSQKNENDGPSKVMVRAKNNLGRDGGGFGFELDIGMVPGVDEISRIRWLEPIEGSAREMLNEVEEAPTKDSEKKAQADEIRRWLEAFLCGGEKLADEIMASWRQSWRRYVMDTKRISVVSAAALLALTATASAGPMVASSQLIAPPQTQTEHVYYR